MCSLYLEVYNDVASHSLFPAYSSVESVWLLQGLSDHLRRKNRMPCMAVRLECKDVSCCSCGQQHIKLGSLGTVRN